MAETTENGTLQISVKGNWVSVPALQVNGKTIVVRGNRLKIASVHDEAWLETELEDPQLCVKLLKEQKSAELKADIFTFTQKLPAIEPKYSYPLEWESVAAIPLTTFKAWWEGLPQESRKNVRRAEKRGVTIQVRGLDDDVIRGIMEVNDDSQVRQGRRFTHFGKTFEQVKRDHSGFLDRSDFICAYLGDEFIGFLKIVYRGDIASMLQLLAKSSHYDQRPTNAMIAKAVELCEAKKMSYVTYGQFTYGKKKDSSVVEFKVRNGFQEKLVPKFYIPLTKWGALCLKMKFHRGLLGILPHNVIAFGVNARAKWYHRRFSTRAGVAQR
jgi:hypothetical protein